MCFLLSCTAYLDMVRRSCLRRLLHRPPGTSATGRWLSTQVTIMGAMTYHREDLLTGPRGFRKTHENYQSFIVGPSALSLTSWIGSILFEPYLCSNFGEPFFQMSPPHSGPRPAASGPRPLSPRFPIICGARLRLAMWCSSSKTPPVAYVYKNCQNSEFR